MLLQLTEEDEQRLKRSDCWQAIDLPPLKARPFKVALQVQMIPSALMVIPACMHAEVEGWANGLRSLQAPHRTACRAAGC